MAHLDKTIKLLRRKDQKSWSIMYEEFADSVFRFVLYRCRGDRDRASDVTQEVFLRAMESIQTYKGDKTGLLRWMKGIGRRVLAQDSRERKPVTVSIGEYNRDTNPQMASQVEGVDPGPLADEQLVKQEEQWLTGMALTALPENWEWALRWKYCEELKVAEIAKRLGISTKAAESILSRARTGFRSKYEQLASSGGRFSDVEEWIDE